MEKSIISKLFDLYESEGCYIFSGYLPKHFNDNYEVLSTFISRDGMIQSSGGGISIHEVLFLESFNKYIDPQNILVIGNSYGFSTIALKLIFPNSQVIAIEKFRNKSAEFTNYLLSKICNMSKVYMGSSPEDVENICSRFETGKVDFAFIDGYHTDQQQLKDYNAISLSANLDCVYLFHDVINCKMHKSFYEIIDKSGLFGTILPKTISGMGIIFNKKKYTDLFKYIKPFSDINELLKGYVEFQTNHECNIDYLNQGVSAKKIGELPHPQL